MGNMKSRPFVALARFSLAIRAVANGENFFCADFKFSAGEVVFTGYRS
ncbi:putative exported protein [Citrobacter rodentium ICC168]|uniref:Exported protein n=1 Tax=Citrobacter rodentium (strain ICC168) TaxID=637910 RepID=D2TJ94_CITRI|nr:putative exported protein [Citrobacter rodentium ICC168]